MIGVFIMGVRFTEKEKKEIDKTYKKVIKSLWKIWEISPVTSIELRLDLDDSGKKDWRFEISDNNPIWLYDPSCSTHWYKISEIRNSKVFYCDIELELKRKILLNYENIKSLLLEKMKEGLEKRAITQKRMDEINKMLDRNEASIEIDFPYQNQQQIKVTCENGKTIGTLDFGDRIIKFITSGNIVLVNQKDKDVVKRK